jgi:hypothetical protein
LAQRDGALRGIASTADLNRVPPPASFSVDASLHNVAIAVVCIGIVVGVRIAVTIVIIIVIAVRSEAAERKSAPKAMAKTTAMKATAMKPAAMKTTGHAAAVETAASEAATMKSAAAEATAVKSATAAKATTAVATAAKATASAVATAAAAATAATSARQRHRWRNQGHGCDCQKCDHRFAQHHRSSSVKGIAPSQGAHIGASKDLEIRYSTPREQMPIKSFFMSGSLAAKTRPAKTAFLRLRSEPRRRSAASTAAVRSKKIDDSTCE